MADSERKRTKDIPPLLDRIGAKNVNIIIGVLYLLLTSGGIAVLLFMPIFPNTDWTVAAAMGYSIGIFLIHFSIIGAGALLVPDYVYYPVQPSLVYMLADLLIFFSFVGVVASYILSPLSSTMPLFGTWVIILGLCVHLYKLYSLVWGSASQKKDTGLLAAAA